MDFGDGQPLVPLRRVVGHSRAGGLPRDLLKLLLGALVVVPGLWQRRARLGLYEAPDQPRPERQALAA
jgi:hypothetical protein